MKKRLEVTGKDNSRTPSTKGKEAVKNTAGGLTDVVSHSSSTDDIHDIKIKSKQSLEKNFWRTRD